MLTAGLMAAVTATKWLLAAKIMTTVGSAMVAVAPAVEKIKQAKRS